MNKTIEQIVEEVFAWAAETFPNTSIEDLLRKLSEEEKELSDAASTYLAPWSDLDGPFSPERAAQIGKVRRHDLLDEIADNVIILARLTNALGGDFREVLQNKWDIVRARDNYRQLEPEIVSNDKRTINERSSDDSRFVIIWNVGRGFYLAKGDSLLGHWTSNFKAATKFYEDEVRELFLKDALSEIGPIVVWRVE